jgi:thiol-disulfide isomerase/thioredoxin
VESLDNHETSERGSTIWPLYAILAIAAVALVVVQLRRPALPNQFVGLALPDPAAEGWLNSQGPITAADLRGKVVLLDFWSTTCPPCLRHMPELAEFNKQFKDTGLTVVGLTPEAGADEPQVRRYVESVNGLDWPIGYGAGYIFRALGVYGTPTYILFDRTGRSVWAGHSLNGLEEAAVGALAKE